MSAAEELEPETALRRAWLERRPILDREGATFGYELRIRSSPAGAAPDAGERSTSAQTVMSAFSEVGVDDICGPDQKLAFLLDDAMLAVDGLDALEALPRHRVLFVAPRTPGADEPLAETLRAMSERGLRLVLPADAPEHDEVLRFAELATVDARAHSPEGFSERIAALRRAGVPTVARRVETRAEHARALAAGADYVQGFYFQVPEMVSGTHIPASHQAALSLLSKVQDDETPVLELERLIGADASLSYRLLRLLSTGRFATRRKVDSIKHALVLLGRRRLAQWVSLLALAGIDDRPAALLEQSILRARMCELLGARHPEHKPAAFFTVGLLSAIDAMLGRPLAVVLEGIPLAPPLAEALLTERNELGRILAAVKDYATGEWRAVDLHVVAPHELADAYFDAARYSVELMGELSR